MAIKAIIAGGGAGGKAIRTLSMMDTMKNFHLGDGYEPWDIILSYKDQGNKDRERFERETMIGSLLRSSDHASRLFRSPGNRNVIDITKSLRTGNRQNDEKPLSAEWISKSGEIPMDPDKLDLILSSFEQAVDTGYGYLQRPGLASVITCTASAYKNLIQRWVDAMLDGEELYLVVLMPLQGAEGIGTGISILTVLRSTIHDRCMEKGMSEEQERELIKDKRNVLVVALGGYRPPAGSSTVLASDYKKRSTRILASVAEVSKDKADGLIYIASDDPLVLSGKQRALGGDQDYHNSLIFLQAAKAVENWMTGSLNQALLRSNNNLNILVDPIHTLGQGKALTYNDFDLPEGWKEMIATYLSFSAAFLLAVRPMINGGEKNIRYQPLFRSVFGNKALNQMSDKDMENNVIQPITLIAELLHDHLVMLHEIGSTGTDWIKKPVQYNYSLVSLYDGPALADLLNRAQANTGNDVGFDLKKLTAFFDGEDRNTRSGSLYLDKVIAKVIEESENRKGFFVRRSEPSMDLFKAFRSLYETVRI